MTDAGLIHLAGLNDLEYLYLDGTPVTDRGLMHLKRLERLRHLSADDVDVMAVERWRAQQQE